MKCQSYPQSTKMDTFQKKKKMQKMPADGVNMLVAVN